MAKALRLVFHFRRQSWLHLLALTLAAVQFVTLPATAYGSSPTTPPRRIVMRATDAGGTIQVPFQTVAKGYQSGISEPLEIVARNQADWTALWKKHASTESNPPPAPAIDFGKEMVVAVFLGERPTGGHDIEITSVERSGDNLVVSFVERSPQPGGVVTQAFTQPFHIVRVAAQSSGTVNFRRLS